MIIDCKILSFMSSKFVSYYQKELEYLRNAGHIFANQHPKIARRLELSNGESSDPHVERLIESFAFLTAQINQSIDDRFPETAAALLGVLYPHLVNPVPSMTVCQFKVDPHKGKLGNGYTVPKSTTLLTHSAQDITCRFKTVYPVTILPLILTKAEFCPQEACSFPQREITSPWYLSLTFKAIGTTVEKLNLNSFRIYLQGEQSIRHALYENFFAQSNARIHVSSLVEKEKKVAIPLANGSLGEVGFARSEMALPVPSHGLHAYQLLQEYFHFPNKFLFFDILGLEDKQKDGTLRGEYFDVLLPIAKPSEIIHKQVSEANFQLGCTPIINLFHKITDPLRLDQRKIHYRLIPDQRRERTTEIFSIESVMAVVEGQNDPEIFSPYFSFAHHHKFTNQQVLWHHKRVSAENRDIPGTEVLLSFVDLAFNPILPANKVVYANTLCTNRFLAEQIPANGELQIEEKIPLVKIVCLEQPVSQVYSPLDGETLWLLISQLTVNHLSLTQGKDSVKALKELLYIYAKPHTTKGHQEVEQIEDMSCRSVVRRIGTEPWRGFVQGLEMTLQFNNLGQAGNNSFLLAAVLRHYFSLSVAANSFVEVVLKDKENYGERMRWNPLPSKQIQL